LIGKKIKNIILKVVLLLILYGNLILLYFNNENKTFEFLCNDRYKNKTFLLIHNYSFNNNSYEFLENYKYKIKTFQFLIENEFKIKINKQIDLDYENINFAVIKAACTVCGLFSNYIVFLGCIRKYMIQGFIPILELESYKNVINGFMVDPLKGNPWEYYFNQPFGYQYSNIKQKAKKIKYVKCNSQIKPNSGIFLNKEAANYWHNFAAQYMPIKNEIIKESNYIISKIFNKSRNLLGVLLRGTDYVAKKPHGHYIPPKTKDVIKDVKLLDNKNKYDGIFLATEDNFIREEFLKAIGNKVKCLLNKRKIYYNYSQKQLFAFNVDFKKNINFNKIYLLNIIILSKCLDFLTAKTSGAIGAFILTNGFRNYKVYNLGHYK
jgi:hypothetical protein